MLNFEKTLLIGLLLDLFVANVGGREGGGLVRLRKGVENPNIDEGALERPSPHSICRHVQASLILPDSRAETKLLSCEGFQVRLYRDVGGNPLQQTSCDITNFVVVDAGVTSSRTRQCVGHSELAATGARGGQTLHAGASCTGGTVHRGILPWRGRSRGASRGGMSASWMPPSPQLDRRCAVSLGSRTNGGLGHVLGWCCEQRSAFASWRHTHHREHLQALPPAA